MDTVACNTHIRWMIRRDMLDVKQIEHLCFGNHAWREGDFIHALRQRNTIGMVAERNGGIVGFMIYELHKNRLHIMDFAVHPEFQRSGVGRAMVGKLTLKLSADRRNRIMIEVRERHVDAQLFFAELGFRAISVIPDLYDDSIEDAYLFQYRFRVECEG